MFVKFHTESIPLGDVIDKLSHNEIVFEHQDRLLFDIWNYIEQSKFIESIFLNVPLNSLYLHVLPDNRWSIIDGYNRLNALNNFVVKQNLKLENLTVFKVLNDKYYTDLEKILQRKLKTVYLNVSLLDKENNEEICKYVYNILNKDKF